MLQNQHNIDILQQVQDPSEEKLIGNTMKRREGKGPPPSTDLLVCFPSRTRLTLMPKALCSPAKPSEPNNRRHHHHDRLKGGGSIVGQPSQWSQTKPLTTDNDEPSSPKVTCAGQIKIRHEKHNSCKNWQSVMEEIERLHDKKHDKRHTWVESLGFKKEILQFLTCLRTISLDFRCFGSFPTSSDIVYNDEDEDENDEDFHDSHLSRAVSDESVSSRTAFSKWFMVLQENIPNENFMNNYKFIDENEEGVDHYDDYQPCAPPSNALLLMRSRSAPVKSWLEEMEQQDYDDNNDEADADEDEEEEEKKRNKENESLVLMKYSSEFDMLSTDIVKETWVVGGIKDALSRSRSWKR